MEEIKLGIIAYICSVRKINILFSNLHTGTSIISGVRKGHIPKEGLIQIDKVLAKYYFHGIGCRVNYHGKSINFDYQVELDREIFSVYDVIEYLEIDNTYFLEIESHLEELVSSGFLQKIIDGEKKYYSITKSGGDMICNS